MIEVSVDSSEDTDTDFSLQTVEKNFLHLRLR